MLIVSDRYGGGYGNTCIHGWWKINIVWSESARRLKVKIISDQCLINMGQVFVTISWDEAQAHVLQKFTVQAYANDKHTFIVEGSKFYYTCLSYNWY